MSGDGATIAVGAPLDVLSPDLHLFTDLVMPMFSDSTQHQTSGMKLASLQVKVNMMSLDIL